MSAMPSGGFFRDEFVFLLSLSSLLLFYIRFFLLGLLFSYSTASSFACTLAWKIFTCDVLEQLFRSCTVHKVTAQSFPPVLYTVNRLAKEEQQHERVCI